MLVYSGFELRPKQGDESDEYQESDQGHAQSQNRGRVSSISQSNRGEILIYNVTRKDIVVCRSGVSACPLNFFGMVN